MTQEDHPPSDRFSINYSKTYKSQLKSGIKYDQYEIAHKSKKIVLLRFFKT